MMAYANPEDRNDEKNADGYGLRGSTRRHGNHLRVLAPHGDVSQGDKAHFGWPITVDQDANDGREVAGWLPEL